MFSLKILMCFTEILKMKTYAAWLPIPTPRSFPKQVVSISFSTWFPFALASVYDSWEHQLTPCLLHVKGRMQLLPSWQLRRQIKGIKPPPAALNVFIFTGWRKPKQTNNGKGCHSLSLVFNKPFFIILSLLLQIGAILWSSLFLFSGDTRARRD